MMSEQPTSKDTRQSEVATTERLTGLLRQVILLRETGPKSAAWHRARKQTMWRLHALLEARQRTTTATPHPDDLLPDDE